MEVDQAFYNRVINEVLMEGWVKVHRSITNNKLWCDKPFSKGQAWIDLIILSNHRPNTIKVKNGQTIEINRGECGYSHTQLALRWGWSRGKLTRFIKLLIDEKMVQQKMVHNHSIINILHYDIFQSDETNSKTNSKTNRPQTVKQTDTSKNEKNDKNEKKSIGSSPLSSLFSDDEIINWLNAGDHKCQERLLGKFSSKQLVSEIEKAYLWQTQNKKRKSDLFLINWLEKVKPERSGIREIGASLTEEQKAEARANGWL